jgi:hypothetical protein
VVMNSPKNLEKIRAATSFCRIFIVLMVIAALGFIPLADVRAVSTTRYVAPTGVDNNDCTSPAIPCRNIQNAVIQSSSGDVILVAAGTYTYAGNSCSNLFGTGNIVCIDHKSLTILGGYSGSNWTTRNPTVNQTIIDGQNAYRGVAVFGDPSNGISIDLEGFTIQNSRVVTPTFTQAPDDPNAMGGGMLAQYTTVILRDVIFSNNQAIGKNTSSGDGGSADGSGIRIESAPSGSTSLFQRVTFDNNRSFGGTGPVRGGVAFGALFIYSSKIVVEDSTFTNNLAQAGSSAGSGISSSGVPNADALGGGITVENCAVTGCSANTIVLTRITVTGNQVRGGDAATKGGGAFGGGIIIEDTASTLITDSYIANNIATAGNAANGGFAGGGGIQSQNNGEVNLQRTTLQGNSSIGGNSTGGNDAGGAGGGGMYAFTTFASGFYHATFTNVLIAENLVQQGTGVTRNYIGVGAGIISAGVDMEISHATFARNRFTSPSILGQAFMVQTSAAGKAATLNIHHSIIAEHTEAGVGPYLIVVAPNATVNFNKGLFSGNSNLTIAGGGTVTGLATMQSATSAGFVSPGAPNHNYHLLSTSAARDQAVGSTVPVDIDNQPRPSGPASDYGVDEYLSPDLSALPNSLIVMVDNNDQVSRVARIDVSFGSAVSWTAATAASWLYLGPAGTSSTTSGTTGNFLTFRFVPANASPGDNQATITITSPSAASTTITLRLLKVGHIETIFSPLLIQP